MPPQKNGDQIPPTSAILYLDFGQSQPPISHMLNCKTTWIWWLANMGI